MAAVQVVITLDEKGQINVQGPLENKLMMFGLLEIAKETVIKYNDNAEKRIVTPPLNFQLPPS